MAIKVFLVDDSPVVLAVLQRILKTSPDLEIVGTAANGSEALSKIPTLKPHVVCTDLKMGTMGGLELTQKLMAEFPVPILVVSSAVQSSDRENIFQLLQAGAVDVFPKPRSGLAEDYPERSLLNKIKIVAGVKVFKKRHKGETPAPAIAQSASKTRVEPRTAQFKLLAIGASTGGPPALEAILKQLPAQFPLPIVCVQHISQGFLDGLIGWLDAQCALSVKIAQRGETPTPGCVYFAPDGYHLEIDKRRKFVYSDAPAFQSHRPSVTVTFQSVAQSYGKDAIAVLLTGMGRDGADGMSAIAQAGGETVAQNEETCVVFGMPREAIALGAARHVLALEEISPFLTRIVGDRRA